MPTRGSRLTGALLLVVLLAAPLAAHLALVTHRAMGLAGALIALQAGLVSRLALPGCLNRALRAGVGGVVFLGVLCLAQFADGGPVVASAAPYGMAYLALLTLFTASLRAGHEPVVTILARRSRGGLPAETTRYTRRVTVAWCWFFLAQLVASLLLLLWAPREVWSGFINLCNVPLIVVMFGAEYAYRQWRHATRSPERLVDTLRVFRQIRTVPHSEDR